MAKRRTRKQKTQARHSYEYSLSNIDLTSKRATSSAKKNSKKQPVIDAHEIYSYDIGLIKKDLFRTVFVSLIILTVELFFYYYS